MKRLSKALAAAGVASRRKAEELIFAGRVSVNGKVVTTPQTMVNWEVDTILVDGAPIQGEEKKAYFLLNKPKGYLCSNQRLIPNTKLVIDLFENEGKRLFTVGRLDKDTEGLIIVTNDGHFANALIHPSSNIEKEYLAKTNREITLKHLETLAKGTEVEGVWVKPKKVKKVRKGTVKITVMEGKKREVRLLMESAGLEVLSLVRIRLGSYTLGELPIGHYRKLTQKEIDETKKIS